MGGEVELVELASAMDSTPLSRAVLNQIISSVWRERESRQRNEVELS